MTEDAAQAALFDVVAVECFFDCGTTVRDPEPSIAHDTMEQHYRDHHRADVDRLVGSLA